MIPYQVVIKETNQNRIYLYKIQKGSVNFMKKLLRSSAAKIIAYILLALSGITSVASGLGIYSAIVLKFYNMPYYVPD